MDPEDLYPQKLYEPKTFYGKVIKRVEECIWDYLDSINFDCDGMEIELDENIIKRNIDVKIKDQDETIYSYQLDPFAPYFDPRFSARLIAEQFVTAYSRRLELTNKLKQAFSDKAPVYYHDPNATIQAEMERLKKEHAKIRDTVDAAYYAYVMKNYLNNKEDNKMAQFKFDINCDEAIPVPKSQEEIDRENKLIELERTMKDKIKAAKDEYALAVKQMQEEEKALNLVKCENEAAMKWRIRYQACVDAGFTEEQAWKMLMQDLGA